MGKNFDCAGLCNLLMNEIQFQVFLPSPIAPSKQNFVV